MSFGPLNPTFSVVLYDLIRICDAVPISVNIITLRPTYVRLWLRSKEWVSFGIEHVFVEVNDIWRREDQVKVLEGLGQPETL